MCTIPIIYVAEYEWQRGEVYTEFWGANLRERGHLEDLGVDGRIILR